MLPLNPHVHIVFLQLIQSYLMLFFDTITILIDLAHYLIEFWRLGLIVNVSELFLIFLHHRHSSTCVVDLLPQFLPRLAPRLLQFLFNLWIFLWH